MQNIIGPKTLGELTILGCGDSAGTPRAGNFWGKCDPSEPKNYRTRPSVCLKTESTTVIVDTGPDFRLQMNRENIQFVDAVIYTHAHGDHVNGMDDLKYYHDRNKRRVPIYCTQETETNLRERFKYIFVQESALYPPIVETNILSNADMRQQKLIGDIGFVPFEQMHGDITSLGIRWGNIAYSTDMVNLSDESVECLKGIKTWIVDGANLYLENPIVHASLKRILELNERIGADEIYLMHMKFDLDYQTLVKTLPQGISPSYDGQKFTVSDS